jgi:hypothetical protein
VPVRVHTRRLSAALACIGAIAVLVGLPLVYAGHVLSSSDQFTSRATRLLDERSVRSLIASRVADQAVASDHVPATLAPVVRRAVDRVVGTRAFRLKFQSAIADLHESVFVQGSDTATLRLAGVGPLVVDAIRRSSPALAAQIPRSATRFVTEISGGNFGQATKTARAIQSAHTVGTVLLIAGGLVFLLAIVQASGARRIAARQVGVALLVDGVALLAIYTVLRPLVLDQFGAGDDRNAATAVWNAFMAGVRTWAIVLAAAGAAVAAVMWLLSAIGRGGRAPGHPAARRSPPVRSAPIPSGRRGRR